MPPPLLSKSLHFDVLQFLGTKSYYKTQQNLHVFWYSNTAKNHITQIF